MPSTLLADVCKCLFVLFFWPIALLRFTLHLLEKEQVIPRVSFNSNVNETAVTESVPKHRDSLDKQEVIAKASLTTNAAQNSKDFVSLESCDADAKSNHSYKLQLDADSKSNRSYNLESEKERRAEFTDEKELDETRSFADDSIYTTESSFSILEYTISVSSDQEEEEKMGARQSKRSVDISSTPKKEKLEGGQEEKLEKIEEGDVKVQNGTAPHADGKPQESTENQSTENANESASAESTEKTAPAVTEGGDAAAASPTTEGGEAEKKEEGATSPDEKKPEEQAKSEEKSEKKKKEKTKKKWSFRSISFSKKDKSKPSLSREESKSNDLAKEAPVPEETTAKSGSEETSPSEPEAATPAVDEAAKEIVPPTETKKEETSIISDIKSAVCSLTSAAESEGTKIVEETKVVTTEAKEAINTIVEAGSKLIESGTKLIESGTKTVVEESKTTTIMESASIIKTSTKTIEIVEETMAPPLPASPPPTEAPPPTPVAPQPAQHEHEDMNGGGESMAEMPEENELGDNNKLDDEQEDIMPKEMNGGGESMAEMPEENGLGENEKLDDDQEDIIPKVNGHNESPVNKVEEITECLLKTSIEEKHVIDNHLEVAVDDGKTQE